MEWVWRRIWNISPYSFHNIVHCAESIRMDQLCLWNPTTRELKRLNFTYGLQIIRNIAARCVNLLRSEGGKVKCRLTKHIIKLLSWNIVISLKVMYLLQFVPYILSTKSLIKFDLRSPMIETACISRKVKSVSKKLQDDLFYSFADKNFMYLLVLYETWKSWQTGPISK